MLKEAGMPVMFGNVSHRNVSEYDVLLMSHSVVPEALNLPRFLRDSGIPLSHEERLLREDLPLVVYGGQASSSTHWVYGEIPEADGGGHSLVDCCNFGFGEDMLDYLIKEFLEYNIEHGSVKKNKAELITHMIGKFNFFFYPTAYEYVYDKDIIKILEIKRLRDDVPARIKMGDTYSTNYPGLVEKVFNIDGADASTATVQLALGCSGPHGACSFCMEGTIAGPFREVPWEKMKKDIWLTKRNSASNTISFYAYNLNYYSRLFQLLQEGGSQFSNLSLITMRMDEMSVNPDFLQFAKHLGLIHLSMAVEGIGSRMRNDVYNKNLSRAQMMAACRNAFNQKFIMLKMGMVLSGHETEEDIKDYLSELDEVNERN